VIKEVNNFCAGFSQVYADARYEDALFTGTLFHKD